LLRLAEWVDWGGTLSREENVETFKKEIEKLKRSLASLQDQFVEERKVKDDFEREVKQHVDTVEALKKELNKRTELATDVSLENEQAEQKYLERV